MTNHTIKLFLSAMVLLSACSNGTNNNAETSQADSSSVEVIDNASNNESVSATPENSEGITDYALFDVKGKVKKIDYYLENSVITFDENGKVTSIDNFKINPDGTSPNSDFCITRDEKGRISSRNLKLQEFGITVKREYIYDDNNRLLIENVNGLENKSSEKSVYGEDGFITDKIISGYGEGQEYKSTKHFSYVAFDAKGNWTTAMVYHSDTNETLESSRTIEYYE